MIGRRYSIVGLHTSHVTRTEHLVREQVYNNNNNNNNKSGETSYLFQRISVLMQRFNATLLHESFADENRSDD